MARLIRGGSKGQEGVHGFSTLANCLQSRTLGLLGRSPQKPNRRKGIPEFGGVAGARGDLPSRWAPKSPKIKGHH